MTSNATPDPQRLGGLGWVRRTNGALTKAEKRRFLGVVVKTQGSYIAGRLKLATGRVPKGAAALDDPALLSPPDSAFARAAEAACAEQKRETIGHSYRSWAFGRAFAALDDARLDPEILYTAALVHDHGLEHPVPGEDFTIRSADRLLACAREANADETLANRAADAIVAHSTPGGSPEADAEGAWLQAGALCDLTGDRLWHLPAPWVQKVVDDHPRDGLAQAITAMVKAESKAVPDGRFALINRCGFSAVVKTAPKFGER